ncbi:MAG: hypothetical protein OSB75_03645, partial [Dehalococcoidia bacterium]|nr:hypothetical protein [Dehalococcoidia bacterium]
QSTASLPHHFDVFLRIIQRGRVNNSVIAKGRDRFFFSGKHVWIAPFLDRLDYILGQLSEHGYAPIACRSSTGQ